MNAPTDPVIWQASAQGAARVSDVIAMRGSARHCFKVGQGEHSCSRRHYSSTPTPSLRSGPSQAGPTLCAGRMGANCVGPVKICFEIRDIAVVSAALTTNQRGSLPCASRLSFSPFCPRRWPVACRTPRRVALPVRQPVPSSLTQPRVTFLPALSSAGWRASLLVGSSWACRPATRATDPHLNSAAFGRTKPSARTIRADRPGGPLRFACFEGGR